MMELKCALVLTLAGLVAANPYGYGVKGGAGAKADAAAIAGAFGGAPSIPAGGSYSGSYSKSSSSSFASSSASSSSSSFSYSGSGIIGPSGSGCASGACQKGSEGGSLPSNSGLNNHGFGFPANSGANAAAIAAAGASAGSYSKNLGLTPCTGDNCSNQEPGCQGSNCGDTSKCTSGTCGTSSLPSSSGPDNYGNNDIPVTVAGNTGSKTTSDAHSSAYDKTTSSYQVPVAYPGCSNGNCVPSPSNTNPATPDNLKPKCDSPNCNGNTYNSQSNAQSITNAPATYLTAPKEYPNPGTGRLPLNYNVPNQNTYLTPATDEKGNPCTSGKCNGNQPRDSYNPANGNSYSTNYLGPNFPNTEQKDLLNNNKCTSGNCGSSPTYNKQNPTVPGYAQSTPVYQTPSGSGGNCASGNCGNYPTSGPSNTGTSPYPSYKVPSFSPKPNEAGGNCASGNCDKYPLPASTPTAASTYPSTKFPNHQQTPTGCATGNCDKYPLPVSTPGASTYPSSKFPSYQQTPTGCASGNCDKYPVPSIPTGATYESTKFPSYQQTPGCASGNCGNYNSPVAIPAATANSGSKPPSYSQPAAGPAQNCVSGICGSYPSPPPTSTGTYPGSNIPSYPPTGTSSGGNCASGNCGNYPPSSPASTGSSTYPSSKIPSYSQGTSPSYNSPSPTVPTNCGTSNCVPSSPVPKPSITFTPPFTGPSSPNHYGAAAGANAQAGSVGISKPASGVYSPPEEKLPPYTGGFGGPSGILKPHDYSLPSKPAYPLSPQPANQNVKPGVNTFPTVTPTVSTSNYYNKPAYKPSSCASGNCGSQPAQPSHGHSDGPNSIKGGAGTNAVAGASASANSVAYSGGFGGPPGLLKPYDGGKLESNAYSDSFNKPTAGYQQGGIASSNNSPHGGSGNSAGSGSTSGNHSAYSKSLNVAGNGVQTNAGTHAATAAGATSGAINHGAGGHTGECDGGCVGSVSSPYGDQNIGFGNAVAGASAKSIAGATNGAGGSFSQAGSFAASSASAHASAGFPRKGGYGRR